MRGHILFAISREQRITRWSDHACPPRHMTMTSIHVECSKRTRRLKRTAKTSQKQANNVHEVDEGSHKV